MAKRFTETEKWKDPWFFELPNDARIVWLYLLDECDNAGIWQCSIKRLNFNCNTNFTEDDLLKYFSERLVKISSDRFLIKKFCEYQYGFNFMKSKNKAVVSAIDKLKNYNLIIEDSNGNYTLSIPYLYPMDTPKDKDKEKDIDKVQDKNQVKEQVKNIMAEFDKHFAEL
jgi:hypothetical protein